MKIPTGTLVAAMDGRKMLLMRNEGDATKPRLETILQEEDRNPKTSLQGTDRPGRSFSSASPRRSAYSDTDWHDEAETAFIISATEKLAMLATKVAAARALTYSAAELEALVGSDYRVTAEADRMGIRLLGPALQYQGAPMISEGIPLGAVQVPPDGQPIVLLNDRQTIGGYPRLGALTPLALARRAATNRWSDRRLR